VSYVLEWVEELLILYEEYEEGEWESDFIWVREKDKERRWWPLYIWEKLFYGMREKLE
jgi:hypothetical protein